MILRELTVTNYRSFQNESFIFSPRVTVIAGVNGRGKSTILDGVSLLLSRLLPQVTPAKGGYKYLRPQDIHRDAEDGLKLTLSVTFENIPVTFSVEYDQESGQRPTKLLPQIKQEIRRIYGNPQRVGDAAPIAVYYTTDRAAYRLPKRLLKGLSQDQKAAYHGALTNRQIDFRDFMSRYQTWADSVANRSDRDGKNQRTLNTIDRAIQEFLPGFSDVRVETQPLRLLVSKQGQQLDLTQMSDGERALLAIMIDLCRRLVLANPELDDPLEGTGVVLIDEIELHLHPKWQREIVDKLRRTFPRIQFVLTTHSPFLIQSLRDGELIRLDMEDADFAEYSDRSIEDITENVMGVPTPQKSQRYLAMIDAAERYFRLLQVGAGADEAQLQELKIRLDELSEPFSDDPAFQALLRVERTAALGEGS
ncbi:MAG: AAA family ATPase [Rhodoferax sp.]|nr:AAA family ATPase [Rhodoferax sp.]